MVPIPPTRWRFRQKTVASFPPQRMPRSFSNKSLPIATQNQPPGEPPDRSRQLESTWLHLRPGLGNLPQRRDIHFGVNLSSLNGAVAQDGGNVFERCDLPHHVCDGR